MVWEKEQEKAFKEIKREFTNDPALGLPHVMKPFFLYVHERLGTAVGVLTQLLGSWQFPEAGCTACAPWWPLLSWWMKQTNLLWKKNSQFEFPTVF
jgi:hypothetical protein